MLHLLTRRLGSHRACYCRCGLDAIPEKSELVTIHSRSEPGRTTLAGARLSGERRQTGEMNPPNASAAWLQRFQMGITTPC